MKRITYVLAILMLLGMVILGCESAQSPMELSSQFENSENNLSKSANGTETFIIPWELRYLIPCANGGAGEFVNFTGTLHVVLHSSIDANGVEHFKLLRHPRQCRGIGETTGDVYLALGGTKWVNAQNPPDYLEMDQTASWVNTANFIGKGSGGKFIVHWTRHVTLNANGEMTAWIDNTHIECK